jgi:hypothetical protein
MSELVVQPGVAELGVPDVDAVETEVVSRRNEYGMVSAEWAVGLIAAIAIAGVLLAVVTDGTVKNALLKFVLMVIRAFASNI